MVRFILLILSLSLVICCFGQQTVPVWFLNGELQQSGGYCDVRDAALFPQKWHEAFNMKEYIWFDLIFE